MLEPVLDASRKALLAEERRQLGELRTLLARLDAEEADQRSLARSLEQLDELFLLVVVGEFNSGKSAFINALLGERVLEEGVTPTTSRIALLRQGTAAAREVTGGGVELLSFPAEVLREITIVDTPGTNAVLREHEALTREFVPRSDLVLFVTSADRPFTESERAFLQMIREWGKKVVVIVNKVDILDSAEDVARVVAFVRHTSRTTLGFEPEVFAVSARRAQRARAEADAEGRSASGFAALESYVSTTLDETERFRLKLLNPLGVARRVLAGAEQVVQKRLALLRDDFATLEEIESQLDLHREDLSRDFRFRLADVENVLLDFEKRGNAFFEERLRLGRIFELANRERLREDFERNVVADLPRVVERKVDEIVDWTVASDLRQWQGLMERLARRQAAHAERMIGRVESTFEYDRSRVLDAVRRESQRAVETYDAGAESRRLAQAVRETVAGTALLQVGALGLGAAVTALATTTFADVTGILAAGALSVVGLLLLPARRRRARAELAAKVASMRAKLLPSLDQGFERELERSRQRFDEAIGPYARFVRGERQRLERERDALAGLRDALSALKARVEALGSGSA